MLPNQIHIHTTHTLALKQTQYKHTATCIHAHMDKAKCLYTDETAYKSKGESHETGREHVQVNSKIKRTEIVFCIKKVFCNMVLFPGQLSYITPSVTIMGKMF